MLTGPEHILKEEFVICDNGRRNVKGSFIIRLLEVSNRVRYTPL